MTNRKLTLVLFASLVVTIIVAASPAFAAEQADNSVEGVLLLFRNKTRNWEAVLQGLALSLFWLLAGLEFAWSAIRLALKGADLSEWLSELLTQILFIGFFLALLQNSGAWAKAIVASFQTAADRVATANGVSAAMKPSDVFDVGLSIANKVMDQTSFWHPADSVGLMAASLIVIVCFALIAAFMILAMVESYVAISAGVLFMGFGGSRWTKDYAVRTIAYTVSVGAKLFILQLLVALAQQLFQEWSRNFGTTNSDIVVVGSAIVMLALVKVIPDMVQSLINGASASSGGALLGAAAGAWAGAGAVAATAAGAGMAGAAAGRLASCQLSDPNLNTGLPGDGWLGRTARNLAGAAVRNAGDRLSGRANYGTRLGQMAADMNARGGGDALDKLTGTAPRNGDAGNTIRGDGA
jgi:type IV secretion system protein TrbL